MNGKGNILISSNIKTNNEIQIIIKDDGRGVKLKNQKKIFNSGYSSKRKGWGLGLSLSKRIIVQYHNGKIFIKESEINEGTSIEINLPFVKENF